MCVCGGGGGGVGEFSEHNISHSVVSVTIQNVGFNYVMVI